MRHRLQSRASKTLLGLGRQLRQEVLRSEVKGVTLSMLQQALRAFHISVTPEVGWLALWVGVAGWAWLVGVLVSLPLVWQDLNTLWQTMDVDGVGHVDEVCVLPCLVGETSERRKDCVRKVCAGAHRHARAHPHPHMQACKHALPRR